MHIVWNEHSREYRPNTITSQFNDAHIVVTPLDSGLFRINVHRKPSVCGDVSGFCMFCVWLSGFFYSKNKGGGGTGVAVCLVALGCAWLFDCLIAWLLVCGYLLRNPTGWLSTPLLF